MAIYLRPLEQYFQIALMTYNGGDWWGWKTHDDAGNKIPDADRVQHKYIKIIKDGAVIPSAEAVTAKMSELRDADVAFLKVREDNGKSGKAKLKALGLNENEIAAIYPCGFCSDCI